MDGRQGRGVRDTGSLGYAALAVLAFVAIAPSAHAQSVSCEAGAAAAARLAEAGRHREAAAAYVALAQQRPVCAGRDAILINAAIQFRIDGMIGRAIRVREVLLEHLPQSALAPRATFDQASDYHALAMYDRAADYYLRFAERYPAELGESCTAQAREARYCPDAANALENAVFFYVALGNFAAARAGAELFIRNYARSLPARAATMAYSMALHSEDPDEIVDHAEQFLRSWPDAALDQRAQTLIRLAHTHAERGRPVEASAAWTRVLALVTPDALDAVTGSDQERFVRRARARSARQEAQMHLAEARSVALTRAPAQSGPRSAAGIQAWAERRLSAWRDRQLAALAPQAEALEAVEDGDLPAGTIASLDRLGALHARVLRAADDVAVPAWVQSDDALTASYEGAVDAVMEPVLASALAAYARCLQTATAVRWLSPEAQRCAEALTELDPEAHPPVAELTAEAGWVHEGLAAPRPVEHDARARGDDEP